MTTPQQRHRENESVNPMAYDVMREAATVLGARYVAARRVAKTPVEKSKWSAELFELWDQIREVDPYSATQIASKRAHLRVLLQQTERLARLEPPLPDPYQSLDETLSEEIFADVIWPHYLRMSQTNSGQKTTPTAIETVATATTPRFVSVGGQPGSGKGRVVEAVSNTIAGAVSVMGDELRQFHPTFNQLMAENPLEMPKVTAAASGKWVSLVTQNLRRHQLSAVVETTLRQATMLLAEFQNFRDAGYQTELQVVAVPLELSRQATVTRFQGQVDDFGTGRWTPRDHHDTAAAAVPQTIETLANSGLVDVIGVKDHAGHPWYQHQTKPGDPAGSHTQIQAILEAVANLRQLKNLNDEARARWNARV